MNYKIAHQIVDTLYNGTEYVFRKLRISETSKLARAVQWPIDKMNSFVLSRDGYDEPLIFPDPREDMDIGDLSAIGINGIYEKPNTSFNWPTNVNSFNK